MFNDKPLTGFGPGTFQFQYLPYQLKSEMTRISVTSPWNIPFGKGGTAHSEYFLLLSENGIISFLIYIILILSGIYFGMRNFYNGSSKKLKIISAMVLLGFITYSVHGLFNNFLDTDKAAFLFWSALSILTTLDIQFIENNQDEKK
jgi:O-antigen ligase